MNYDAESLKKHYEWKGKLDIVSKVKVDSKEALSLAYTPGVAAACLEIQKDYDKSFDLTGRWNTVAVITDGTAVLGLGDIGPEAGMPVMEGKCVLFKEFGNVNAVPLCIRSKSADDIVKTVKLLAGSFGGVNLEDISAPRCFEVEERLKADPEVDIPVFHDDQHGTAIVTAAALINALKIVKKNIEDLKVVFSGAGAAGVAIAKLLIKLGVKEVIVCDRKGIICEGDPRLDEAKQKIAAFTNKHRVKGSLKDAMVGADVFVGVSAPGLLTEEMVRSMNEGAIVFPMANPTPEIMPELALHAGAKVVGTGRSDYPNQINNVLAFPGIFRGALDVKARQITEDMKVAAVYAIAGLVSDEELSPEYILPLAFDKRIVPAVSKAVAKAAIKDGVARVK